jgi:endonuclease/exonuclease/phosphatase family metal-dependent hydrolase
VTLQEFRLGSGSDVILAALKRLGLSFLHVPQTQSATEHTILIASRHGFDAGPFMPDDISPVPILEAAFTIEGLGFPLTLLAAHFPQKEPQVPLFQQLLKDTPSLLDGDTLLIGDLNCGIPFVDSMTKTFFATEYFQDMLQAGWIDCWRSRNMDATEYTWYSAVKKHGFRYDQALASAAFNGRISSVRYDHAVREQGISDHSALIVEFGR